MAGNGAVCSHSAYGIRNAKSGQAASDPIADIHILAILSVDTDTVGVGSIVYD